jgi:regulator of protease activity HflC (stomatin/prohibitin superfamily)
MSPKTIIPIVLVVVIVIALGLSVFAVDETEQAIVTRLGKYMRTVSEPGLNFKVPLLKSLRATRNTSILTTMPDGR